MPAGADDEPTSPDLKIWVERTRGIADIATRLLLASDDALADEAQALDRTLVIEPSAAATPGWFRDEADLFVIPDRLDRHAATP